MRKETNKQKTIMLTDDNYNLIAGFHEAIGSKNYSDTINILIGRAFENVDAVNNTSEKVSEDLHEIIKEINKIKEDYKKQTERLIAIYNTGFRLQARTYGLVKKSEESRTSLHPNSWPQDEVSKQARRTHNIQAEVVEKETIRQEFENLKRTEESSSN